MRKIGAHSKRRDTLQSRACTPKEDLRDLARRIAPRLFRHRVFRLYGFGGSRFSTRAIWHFKMQLGRYINSRDAPATIGLLSAGFGQRFIA